MADGIESKVDILENVYKFELYKRRFYPLVFDEPQVLEKKHIPREHEKRAEYKSFYERNGLLSFLIGLYR